MSINKELLEEIIKCALEELYNNDKYLIKEEKEKEEKKNSTTKSNRHVGERSIVFRFGIYLQNEILKIGELKSKQLDCEYNRQYYDKKELCYFENGENIVKKVYPDLIIHKRGSKENILVMEFKTYWNKDTVDDEEKLKDFTSTEYKYIFGVSIIIGQELEKCKLKWYQDGDKVDEHFYRGK